MRGTLASEWGKAWSVRAPWACLVAMAALVGLTSFSLANDFVRGVATGEQPQGATMRTVDAVGPALQLGQLALAAFALQLITAEYSTGLIRATLRAQPRRQLVLGAKALVAGATAAAAGAATGALSAWGSGVVLGGDRAADGPGTLDLALRSAALAGLVAVLVVGLGAALRSAVGTLAASAALLLGTLALPAGPGRWTPGQAGAALLEGPPGSWESASGLLVLVAWAGGVLALGLWLMHRDA